MKNEMRRSEMGNRSFFIVKAILLEFVVTAVFVVLFGVALLFVPSGLIFAAVFATLSLSAGCLAASFFVAKKSGSKGWLYGLIVGGVSFAVITLAALMIQRGNVTGTTLFRFIIMMLASLIGGVLGVNRANTHRYL